MLLGLPVLADERPRGVRCGSDGRQVDDPAHARGYGGVDGRLVLLDAVGGLGAGDEEERVGAVEGRTHVVAGGVPGDPPDLRAGQLRRAARVTHQEHLPCAGPG